MISREGNTNEVKVTIFQNHKMTSNLKEIPSQRSYTGFWGCCVYYVHTLIVHNDTMKVVVTNIRGIVQPKHKRPFSFSFSRELLFILFQTK